MKPCITASSIRWAAASGDWKVSAAAAASNAALSAAVTNECGGSWGRSSGGVSCGGSWRCGEGEGSGGSTNRTDRLSRCRVPPPAAAATTEPRIALRGGTKAAAAAGCCGVKTAAAPQPCFAAANGARPSSLADGADGKASVVVAALIEALRLPGQAGGGMGRWAGCRGLRVLAPYLRCSSLQRGRDSNGRSAAQYARVESAVIVGDVYARLLASSASFGPRGRSTAS